MIYISEAAVEGNSTVILSGTLDRLNVLHKENTFVFDKSLVRELPEVVHLTVDQYNNFKLIWTSEIIACRDGLNSQLARKMIFKPGRYLLSVFIDANNEAHFYSNQVCEVQDIPFKEIGWKSAEDAFRGNVDTASTYYDAVQIKQAKLGKLKPHHSLKALEQQVDMLTEVVATLVSDSLPPSWFQDYLDAVGRTNSLDTNRNAVIANIERNKQCARDVSNG
jgi:hypothetical protein